MEKIRIAIADDHTVLRSGLKAMLNYHPQFEVVGEAANGLETLEMMEKCHPNVLILDLAMPVMGGVECVKEIRHRGILCRILILTMYDDEEYVKEVMRAGADGYILKKSADTELIEGILRVHSGKKFLNENLSEKLMENLLRASDEGPDHQDPYYLLSSREREVIRYLARGYTNGEIGARLSLSPKTIDTYRSRIMDKLKVRRKSELVNYAIKYKLINT
ncbi:Oxygen regulatory protein NreC [Sporomusa ovata DSM 2662]|uniref:Two-component response regulator n=1 Tax=Sporomusa ovata TaxID=2378 RepID=A0A0U1KY02_9FIRM|nr:response regulator transcription factor [Sporomusa ovata]EQB28868.1 oxygen regulatory protein NreC [Sporomusa ovata DSM 2662]CQR72292.1 Two-component response regulator [Sporomusa ovata]